MLFGQWSGRKAGNKTGPSGQAWSTPSPQAKANITLAIDVCTFSNY